MKIAGNTLLSSIAIIGAAVVLSTQPANALRPVSTGSGFAISPDGYIIINNHVVAAKFRNKQGKVVAKRLCRGVTVIGAGYNGQARIIARDAKVDLAVIKVSSSGNKQLARRPSPAISRVDEYESRDREFTRRSQEAFPRQRGGSSNLFESGNERSRELFEQTPARNFQDNSGDGGFSSAAASRGARSFVALNLARLAPGMKANVIGFPLGKKVSSQLKIKRGIVTATLGYGNDSTQFQTDAVINGGNSGGPVVDDAGNLIGVAVAGLSGPQIEGVVFLVNSKGLANFLDTHQIPYQRVGHQPSQHTVQIYCDAKSYAVFVTCFT